MHIPFAALILLLYPPPQPPFTLPKPVNHTFVSSLASDWLVPPVPSFKVLTFIHGWLPNDNEEKNHLYRSRCMGETQREREGAEESCAPVAWLSSKPTQRLRRRLKPVLLENNGIVEIADQRQRGLWIFLYASLFLNITLRKDKIIHNPFYTWTIWRWDIQKSSISSNHNSSAALPVRLIVTRHLFGWLIIWGSHWCTSILYTSLWISIISEYFSDFFFFWSASLGGSQGSQRYWLSLLSTCVLRLSAPLSSKGWLQQCGRRNAEKLSPDYLVS